jgi:hypothetical protein
MFPPSTEEAEKAFDNLTNILKPRRKKGPGFTDPGLDKIVTERLSAMKLFCFNYLDMSKKKSSKAPVAGHITSDSPEPRSRYIYGQNIARMDSRVY